MISPFKGVSTAARVASSHESLLAPSTRLVPGLLITGRSGAGKTSLAHAIARSLEGDRGALTCVYLCSLYKRG
jgi:adenylylsulfate kinase-like enzyme